MYNCTEWWLENTYLTVGQGKALFSRNVKPGIFRLGMVPKENFLVYSTQFVLLTIRLVTGNVMMVAIDICGKSAIMREWIYGIT